MTGRLRRFGGTRGEAGNRPAAGARDRLAKRATLGGYVLAALLLLVSAVVLVTEYLAVERDTEQSTLNLARVLGAQTEAAVSTIDQTIDRVLDAVRGRRINSLAGDPAVHGLLRTMVGRVPFMRALYIVDDRGEVVQTSREGDYRPFSVADREYFQFHRDHPEPVLHIGAPVIGRPTGLWSITLTRRLDAPGGGFGGVVLGVLDPGYLQKLYDALDVGRFGIVSLLLREGQMLVRSPFDETQIGRSLAQAPLFHKMIERNVPEGVDRGPYVSDGRIRITGWKIIEPGPLAIRVALDEKEALAGWRRWAILYGLAMGSFVAVMAVMIRLLLLQLQRREETEGALLNSERLASSTIDALTAPLCVLDGTGAIIVTNRAWRDAPQGYGASPGHSGVGVNYLGVCDRVRKGEDAADAAAFAAGIRAVMAGERSEHVQEYPCDTPGGLTWHVGRVSRFASDGPTRVVVVHQNITERRAADQALLREKERAETYLAISEAIIVELTTEGVIRRINPRGRAMLGYPEDQLVGRNWFDTVVPPAARKTVRAIHRRIIGGEVESQEYYETEVVTRDGDIRFVWWHNGVTRAPDGRITGTLSSGQDVTDRRRMEDCLRESERRLAKAQTIARLGNWELDLISGVVWWSDEVHRIFGRGPREFAAGFADYLRFVHPDDRISLYEQERRLVADGTSINVDHRILLTDGVQRVVNLQAELVPDSDGVYRRAAGIIHDITERKQAELALRTAVQETAIANRTKTEFLANMSHELNTPLNAVIGFSEIMAGEMCGPLGSPKYREFSQVIHDSGRHLQQLIADVLDIAKLDSGELELDEEALDISELIGERLIQLRPGFVTAGLTINAVEPDHRLGLVADRRMVKQILRNLLSNALKFTPPGGAVTVLTWRARDGRLCVAIEDTGVGMAPEDIPRALDRFAQIDGTLSRKHDGAGLGLSLSKLLTEKHGGSVDVVSAVGRGTRVRVWFPPERVLVLEPDFEAPMVRGDHVV